ncbi:MAG: hypothetical protein WDM70_07750 [Nitrosomonadales bacterium]
MQARHYLRRVGLVINRAVRNRIIERGACLRTKVLPGDVDPAFTFAIDKHKFLRIQNCQILHRANGDKQVTAGATGKQCISKIVSHSRQSAMLTGQFMIAVTSNFHVFIVNELI